MAGKNGWSKQCVVWYGTPSTEECDALAASGWHVRRADPASDAAIGLRGEDTVVGVVDVRTADALQQQRMLKLVSRNRHLPLLAVLPAAPEALHQRTLVEPCVGSFTAPLDVKHMLRTLRSLSSDGPDCGEDGIESLVGRSAAMRAIHAAIHKFAPVDLSVLLTGETGTGKEVVARALHERSTRHAGPFAAINCGALPDGLVASELFGHERGAFTGAGARHAGLFESADGGTVLLDEVGDLPLDAQTSLLRVLQDGCIERVGSRQTLKVDVRVIAATNVDLEAAVAKGHFRSDLYYRLNVLRLHLPRLADRDGDVELLAQHFLTRFRQRHALRARGFAPDARRAMRAFEWPGNIRELLNRVQRAAVTTESELIDARALELPDPAHTGSRRRVVDLGDARGAAEQEALRRCLRESNYNVSEVARRLRISRVTVYRLCKKHQVALAASR